MLWRALVGQFGGGFGVVLYRDLFFSKFLGENTCQSRSAARGYLSQLPSSARREGIRL